MFVLKLRFSNVMFQLYNFYVLFILGENLVPEQKNERKKTEEG